MQPAYSFSAASGPLPAAVAEQVAEACRPGFGSILGLPFTSPDFHRLQAETEACLRRLLAIPDDFHVLFMAGGASVQFALLPLNLLDGQGHAAYVDSGHWARRAIAEARRFGRIEAIPAAALGTGAFPLDQATYCHLTSNETADGLQWHDWPALPAPLAADMSSDFLTRPVDWQRVAVAYAGTQKSIGTPGLTVVIARAALLRGAQPGTPGVMDYLAQARAASRLCTPPVFPIFVAHRMLHWIESRGGIPAMARRLALRHARVEAALDAAGGLYRQRHPRTWRSRVTTCFHLPDAALTGAFIESAEAAGLHHLRGHPEIGGIRISLYNGLDDGAVDALSGFLGRFAERHADTGLAACR